MTVSDPNKCEPCVTVAQEVSYRLVHKQEIVPLRDCSLTQLHMTKADCAPGLSGLQDCLVTLVHQNGAWSSP